MSRNEEKKCLGRPKSEEKYGAILMAAGDAFLEQGYKATSIDKIAEAAGVSKATVYSHFPNKEELFQAVIKHKVASYEFDENMQVSEDLKKGLVQIANRFYELLSDPEVIAMHRVVIGESMRHSDMAKMFYKQGPEKTTASLALYLDKHVSASHLIIKDTQQAARQFFFMVAGELLLRRTMNLPFDMSQTALKKHINLTTDQFISLYQN